MKEEWGGEQGWKIKTLPTSTRRPDGYNLLPGGYNSCIRPRVVRQASFPLHVAIERGAFAPTVTHLQNLASL